MGDVGGEADVFPLSGFGVEGVVVDVEFWGVE